MCVRRGILSWFEFKVELYLCRGIDLNVKLFFDRTYH